MTAKRVIKELKVVMPDGSFDPEGPVPIGVDAENIDLSTGVGLEDTLNHMIATNQSPTPQTKILIDVNSQNEEIELVTKEELMAVALKNAVGGPGEVDCDGSVRFPIVDLAIVGNTTKSSSRSRISNTQVEAIYAINKNLPQEVISRNIEPVLTLRGVADSNDEVIEMKKILRRTKEVKFNHTYNVRMSTIDGKNRFIIENIVAGIKVAETYNTNLICNYYVTDAAPVDSNNVNEAACAYEGNSNLYIRDDRFSTVQEFVKYWTNPDNELRVVYALEEPYEEVLPVDTVLDFKSIKMFNGDTKIRVSGSGTPTLKATYIIDPATYISKLIGG